MTADNHEPIADCRLRGALDLFTHTWDPVVLAALRDGPRRRAALRAGIGSISDKALTEALRRLLARGLVARFPRPGAPPAVEYELTPLGVSLVAGPLESLAAWVRTYGELLGLPDDTAIPLRGANPTAPAAGAARLSGRTETGTPGHLPPPAPR
ncbi:winged helix-turn-helix transcriptional regulator [Nocardia carnea]|uniref:winged helix-turn-helix transcriptional regulator n=1 Tax=Nocardia carnea TaxID=37328 RepID=UPI0024575990|nr:helix-turn-helix domain-containing protein [Nocardia carnea]